MQVKIGIIIKHVRDKQPYSSREMMRSLDNILSKKKWWVHNFFSFRQLLVSE